MKKREKKEGEDRLKVLGDAIALRLNSIAPTESQTAKLSELQMRLEYRLGKLREDYGKEEEGIKAAVMEEALQVLNGSKN